MFEKIKTPLKDCFLLRPRKISDKRGDFIKIYHKSAFEKLDVQSDFEEAYYSVSSKGVIRGLHFQTPPHAHVKHITCLNGQLFDVVVDLRKDSPTFGQHYSVILDSDSPMIFSIPIGLAHGFMALTDNCVFLNKTSFAYSPENDSGIKWDSCGIKWPILNSIISDKDKDLIDFKNFNSPF